MNFAKITKLEVQELATQQISASEPHKIETKVEDSIDIEIIELATQEITFIDS